MQTVIDNIKELIYNNTLSSKDDIYIYGQNVYTPIIINCLTQNNCSIKAILDSNKTGEGVMGYRLTTPHKEFKTYNPNAKILIASAYYKQMRKLLCQIDKRYKQSTYLLINLKKNKKALQFKLKYPNLYNFKQLHFNFNSNETKLLKLNKRFHNIHQGERCFILGNGPSLNNIDFSLLKNETIFGVNQIMDFERINDIDLSYWVCYDINFLMALSSAEMIDKVKHMQNKTKACFLDLRFKKSFDAKSNNGLADLFYFKSSLACCNSDVLLKQPSQIPLDRCLYSPDTVVLICLQLAIYMGFKEIYLLGCDETAIIYFLNNYINEASNIAHHANLSTPDVTDDFSLKRIKISGITTEIKMAYVRQKQFAFFNEYCKKHNIKLCNLTEHSLIESIKKDHLENILSKQK